MSKKTRKGIKVGIPPFVEGWYEQTIEELRKDVKKGRGKGLFKRSKANIGLDRRFKDFLMIAQKDIELRLWFSKGFAVRNELGKEIDYEFHHLFGRLIGIFNDINQRFEPSNLSEDLLNHLGRELKLLQEQSGRLWDIQSINPEEKDGAKKLLKDFDRNLIEFSKRMKPYLTQEKE